MLNGWCSTREYHRDYRDTNIKTPCEYLKWAKTKQSPYEWLVFPSITEKRTNTASLSTFSVRFYFSAARKIEKVKERTFILLKCSLSCLHIYSTCWFDTKFSLNATCRHNVFTKITWNLLSFFKHVDTFIKNKAFCDTFPQNDPIYSQRWRWVLSRYSWDKPSEQKNNNKKKTLRGKIWLLKRLVLSFTVYKMHPYVIVNHLWCHCAVIFSSVNDFFLGINRFKQEVLAWFWILVTKNTNNYLNQLNS